MCLRTLMWLPLGSGSASRMNIGATHPTAVDDITPALPIIRNRP